MENKKQYQMPTFRYSRTKYQCYILFGAFDHKEEKMFKAKLRNLSGYSPYRGFEELRDHFNDSKKAISEYVREKILPKISEDIISGQFDKGIDTKDWTKLLQRRKSAEYIPIGNLIDEYIQVRYQMNESISNQDLYYNALTAFKNSLEMIFRKVAFKQVYIKDVTTGYCNQVFENWEKFHTWSAHTRKTYREKVMVFFDAYKHIVPVNPVGKESRIKANEKNKNVPLAKEDFDKIISYLEKSKRKKHKELLGFALLMYNGLLRGDTILKLKCINIKRQDEDNYYIEVYSKIVKNKISGQVVIPKYLVDYLIKEGIYNPHLPDKLLFPPPFKPRKSTSSKAYRQRKGEHLRNRMWASNLWNDVLINELGFSKEFTTLHNIYCLKSTGGLYLFNTEKWDIREISAQMLHAHLITTFIYIDKLRYHNVDEKKRVFRHQVIGKKEENLANESNSPQIKYSERTEDTSEINYLTKFVNR